MRRRNRKVLHLHRGALHLHPPSSTLQAMPASQHGSTSIWTEVTTHVPEQTSTSHPWPHRNWQRKGRRHWRKPRGKLNKKHEKKKRKSESGKRRERGSGREKKKRRELPKHPVLPTRVAWGILRCQDRLTCERPSIHHPPPSPLCPRTSDPTRPPCGRSANTPGPTSCRPPTAIIRSLFRSIPQTLSWPITCLAYITRILACANASLGTERSERGRSERESSGWRG